MPPPLARQHPERARARVAASAASASSKPPPPAPRPPPPPPHQRRAPKDPSSFASYDAIRAHLHGGGGGFIAGLLNALSDRAFGYGGRGGAGAGLYRAFLRLGGASPKAPPDGPGQPPPAPAPTEQSDALAALLAVSSTRAAAIARRCPPGTLAAVPPSELGRRVLALKAALPGCDVAALVEARPDLYLGLLSGGAGAERPGGAVWSADDAKEEGDAASTAGRALAALRLGLPGADVEAVAFEDPALLFHPPRRLARGLRRLRALWPGADAQAL